MNLFILYNDPVKSAQAHGDKHVIKMILEACQMLYTAHWTASYPQLLTKTRLKLATPESLATAPLSKAETRGYQAAHINHPCTKWIRASLENYHYACDLGISLGEEYTYRWGKTHACEEHVRWLKANPPPLPQIGKTPFAIAMDDEYKICDDAVESYRNYYLTAKKEKGLLVYTRRQAPSFLLCEGLLTTLNHPHQLLLRVCAIPRTPLPTASPTTLPIRSTIRAIPLAIPPRIARARKKSCQKSCQGATKDD